MEYLVPSFLAGLLSFFSPCVLPLLPVYVGLLTTEDGSSSLASARRMANTLAFVGGVSVTFLLLGFGVGLLGGALNNASVSIACGIVVFVFGLHFSGLMEIPLLNREKRANLAKANPRHAGGAFLLGLAFSFGWTPCIGPVLGSVLALAAGAGSAVLAAMLLLVYALGFAIPFTVITLGSSVLLSRVRKVNRFLPTIKIIGGILIAVMGLWMVFTQVSELNMAANSLQGQSEQAAQAGQTNGSKDTSSESGASAGSDGSAGVADSSAATQEAWSLVPLETFDGKKVSLSDYAGKPLYVKLWGTWCPVCVAGLDKFAALASERNAQGDITVLSVVAPGFSRELPADEFIAWAQGQNLDFPILMDTSFQLNRAVQARSYPTSLLISSSGELVQMRMGDIAEDELNRLLDNLT